MNIDLNAFRNVAGTDISTGYAVAKTDKNGKVGLEKAAAHRHLQSWNVTPADGENNANLRLALYNLVQETLCGTGLEPQNAMVKAFMDRTAEKLGCSAGEGGVLRAEAKPLERRVIRSVLCGLDAHLAFFNKTDLTKLTPEMLGELAATFDETLSTVSTLASAKSMAAVKLREALTNAAQSLLGGIGLKDGDLSNVSTVRIQEMIILALDGRDLQTPEQLSELLEDFKLSADINSEEIQSLVLKMDEVGQEELKHINDGAPEVNIRALSGKERVEIGMKVAAQAIDNGVKAAGKLFSRFTTFFFRDTESPVKVENPPVKAPEAAKISFGTKIKDVQEMLADIVCDSDTIETDRENGEPGRHLAEVLLRHVKTLTTCLIDRTALAKLPGELRGVAENMISGIMANEEIKAKLGELKPERADVIAFEIDLALKLKPVQDMLGEVAKTMTTVIDSMADTVQTRINEAIEKLFPSNGGSKGDKVAAQPKGRLSAQQMLVSGEFKTLNELVKAPEFEAKESSSQKSSLQNKTYNEVSVKESDGTVHTYITDEIAPASRTIGDIVVEPAKLKKAEADVAAAREVQKETRAKVGQMLINKMLEKTVQDTSSGYTAFMLGAIKTYLTGISTMDRRAMVAAAFRFAKPDIKAEYPKGATEEIKEEIDREVARKNSIQLFGAMMKGAGPIMQKMLQGLASATSDEDFLLALADMRSNLAPISPRIVKANLASMIADSNGRIKEITIKEPLGAASVGQAFMCRFTMQDPKNANKTIQKDVVVKMLRPDAEQRMMREKDIFLKAAAEVSGMSVTFAGQLESLMEELDLRVEAQNTMKGVVYNKGVHDVKSMKVMDVVKPTKYMLVVEKAPGDSVTVDRLMKETTDKLKAIVAAFNPKTEWNGTEHKLITSYTNPDRNFKVSMDMKAKAQKELLSLYEQTLVQQKRLVTLARKWVQEGVYSSGYYHGDLHAGNIMVDRNFKLAEDGSLVRNKKGVPDLSSNKGLTVIDFGNATKLTDDQQKNIIKMMAATAAKDVDAYLDGFYELMTEGGRAKFVTERAKIRNMVKTVFNLGTQAESGQRIALTLQMLQQMGHELPAPIFKFSQCQMRLQGTIEQMNALLEKIKGHYLGLLRSGTVVGTDLGISGEKFEPVCIFNNIFRGKGDSLNIRLIDGEIAALRQTLEQLKANPDNPELEEPLRVPSNLFIKGKTDNMIREIISNGRENVAEIITSYFDNIMTVATDEQKLKFNRAIEMIKQKAAEMKVGENIARMNAYRVERDKLTPKRPEFRNLVSKHTSLTKLKEVAQTYYDRGVTAEGIRTRFRQLSDMLTAGTIAYGNPDFDEYTQLMPLMSELEGHDDYMQYFETELAKIDLVKIKEESDQLEERIKQITTPMSLLREQTLELSDEVRKIMKEIDADYLEASIRHLQNQKDLFTKEMSRRNPFSGSVETMNGAVGDVISDNKFSSLLKIGIGTAFDYQFSGKLKNEQNPE